MPSSLNGDGTYGTDITLPTKSGDYNVNNLGVVVHPVNFTCSVISGCYDWSGSYAFHWYMDSASTYYTKNTSTGVMSTWSAGNLTIDNPSTWDAVQSIFPLGGWDYLNGVTTVSKVRLWAATTYIIYDYSASSFMAVYSIGSVGVSKINYAIFSREI
jgi:hypothetical protein